MQINDVLNSFQRAFQNITGDSAPAEETAPVTGKNLNSSLLTAGNIFEGQVTSAKDGQVTLKLLNGGSLNASLDQGVSIKVGQSLFFEVKGTNNTNQTILKLYDGGGTNNATIFNALKTAGISVSQSSIQMVNSMMENQMSIDKASIQDMVKNALTYPDTDIRTVVDMTKLQIPLTQANIAQYENYQTDKYTVSSQLNQIMGQIPELLASDALPVEETAKLTLDILETFRDTGISAEAPSEPFQTAQDMENQRLSQVQESVGSYREINAPYEGAASKQAGSVGRSDTVNDPGLSQLKTQSGLSQPEVLTRSQVEDSQSSHTINRDMMKALGLTETEVKAMGLSIEGETASNQETDGLKTGQTLQTQGMDPAANRVFIDLEPVAQEEKQAPQVLTDVTGQAEILEEDDPILRLLNNENQAATVELSSESALKEAELSLGQAQELYQDVYEEAQAHMEQVARVDQLLTSETSYEKLNLLSGYLPELLSEEDGAALGEVLKGLSADYPQVAGLLTEEGQLQVSVTGAKLLQNLMEVLSKPDKVTSDQLKSLLTSKAFKAVLNDVMERQWSVTPEDVKSQDKMKDLYQRMDRQLERFQEAFSRLEEPEAKDIAKGLTATRENISFMNQLNQYHTFLQIPLRMMDQNTQSDLYVFTNKRSLQDDGSLTAFLHLDMDHLGSTDVHITMDKLDHVGTHFYLEDEEAFDLIEQNIDVLTARLEAKGYHVNAQVENTGKPVDFVNDFLKAGQSVGTLHRYSFDMTV